MRIQVRPCDDPRRFVDAQRAFYVGDPHYVPPFTAFDARQADPRRHPFFAHATSSFWLAWRDDQIVARISATRDLAHDECHGDRVGFFGHFEARDADAAMAVLAHAARWLRERGATELRGPIDLSTNYRCGSLIEDREPGPPFVSMPYNPLRHAEWYAAFGLEKAKDLVALMCREELLDMSRSERIGARTRARLQPELRHVDLRRFDDEITLLWQVYVSAWEKNWGFAPMSEAEFRHEAAQLRQVIRKELTIVAEIDGRPAGIAIGVPDVHRGVRACNGRLWPFGWWKFQRTMRRVRVFRTLTLGVMREFRKTGLDALLLAELVRSGLANGFGVCEASWILEDNIGMLRPLEVMGGYEYRRYRIYTKALRV